MGGEEELNRVDAYWLEEYRQDREDWRYLNSFIWQAPSVSVVIVGAILGIAFYATENSLVRGFLVAVSALFVSALTFAMHRHHSIQLSRQGQCEFIIGHFLQGKVVRTGFQIGSYYPMLAAMIILSTSLWVLSMSISLGFLK